MSTLNLRPSTLDLQNRKPSTSSFQPSTFNAQCLNRQLTLNPHLLQPVLQVEEAFVRAKGTVDQLEHVHRELTTLKVHTSTRSSLITQTLHFDPSTLI